MPTPTTPDDATGLGLDKQAVIEQMLDAIAQTEFSLADIIHAEAEKIEAAIKKHLEKDDDVDEVDLLAVNKSVERMLRKVIVKEMLLGFQLEDVIELLQPKQVSNQNRLMNN
jgi:Mg2+ and Co2+ transporter CorA